MVAVSDHRNPLWHFLLLKVAKRVWEHWLQHVQEDTGQSADLKVCILRPTLFDNVSGGSEDRITPEAEWIAKQGFKWTDSEEEAEESIPAAEESDEEEWDSFSA